MQPLRGMYLFRLSPFGWHRAKRAGNFRRSAGSQAKRAGKLFADRPEASAVSVQVSPVGGERAKRAGQAFRRSAASQRSEQASFARSAGTQRTERARRRLTF